MSISTRSRIIIAMWKAACIRFKDNEEEIMFIEGFSVSCTSLCLLIKKYKRTGSVADNRTVRPLRKLTPIHYKFLDDCMTVNNELSITKQYTFYFKIDFRPLKLATALSRDPGGSWAGSAKKPDIVH